MRPNPLMATRVDMGRPSRRRARLPSVRPTASRQQLSADPRGSGRMARATSRHSVAAMSTYPIEREVDVALRDGRSAHVRPVRPADEPALRAFLEDLSIDDRVLRFFTAGVDLAAAARQAAAVDYIDH